MPIWLRHSVRRCCNSRDYGKLGAYFMRGTRIYLTAEVDIAVKEGICKILVIYSFPHIYPILQGVTPLS